MAEQWAVGIDIGGTGIKVACVDSATGQLMDEQLRVPTPAPSTATEVAQAVGHALDQLEERSRHTIITYRACLSRVNPQRKSHLLRQPGPVVGR